MSAKKPKRMEWTQFLPYGDSASGRTKARILAAALKIIINEGLSALSMAEVARQAKMSKPLVLYHFQGVEPMVLELFAVTTRVGQIITESAAKEAITPEQKLVASIDGAIAWIEQEPEWARFLLLFYAEAAVNDEIRELHRKVLEAGRARLERVLREAGYDESKANALSYALHGGLVGTMIRMISLREEGKAKDYRKTAIAQFELMTGRALG